MVFSCRREDRHKVATGAEIISFRSQVILSVGELGVERPFLLTDLRSCIERHDLCFRELH